jgi:hypothetical protein
LATSMVSVKGPGFATHTTADDLQF